MARRRFGRNQKRKLKEDAAKWEKAYHRDKHAAMNAINRYDNISSAIRRVARNSALLEPEEIDGYRYQECWYIAQQINHERDLYVNANAIPSRACFEKIMLTPCHIDAAIREHGLHIILRHGDTRVGYSCSWMMTQEVLNNPEYHVGEIASLISNEIARIKKK